MSRNYDDWLQAYVEYASFSEAPKRMHFWSGVSAIAGALRRKVWIDMAYFKWYPNHYIIFVAPPGIVSKSTTVSIAMDLLRRVPGINFGPDIVTWPALVTAFAGASEAFELNGEFLTQCALTIESSEFGNLVNPTDRDMIDLLITLWDAKTGALKKMTKGSGNDTIENPWINMVACTTPSWIAGNFPEHVIGGGFTSRCLFVYTDKKDKLVAYPHLSVPTGLGDKAARLAADLEHIAKNLIGSYRLEEKALEWGKLWYDQHNSKPPPGLEGDDRFGGYLARKQTHIHKLAMVIAASQRDELVITAEDLALANTMVSDLEQDMPKVYAKIGKSTQATQVERFIQFVKAKPEGVPYAVAYQFVHRHFPDARNIEGIFTGAIRAGLLEIVPTTEGPWLRAK
jgi:hypothetical protein